MLFEPVTIGPKTLRNRFYQTPHSTGFGETAAPRRPRSGPRARRAAGPGVNLELTSIDPEADRSPVPTPAQAVGRLRRRARPAAGRRRARRGLARRAPSCGTAATTSTARRRGCRRAGRACCPPTTSRSPTATRCRRADPARASGCYAAAAARAEAAGLDLVYAYGSHSYLPAQFLSPFANRRDDEYGGSLRNRARFWLEVIEAVRTGDRRPAGRGRPHRHRPERHARGSASTTCSRSCGWPTTWSTCGTSTSPRSASRGSTCGPRASTRRATRQHCPAACGRRPRSRSSASAA